MGFLGDGLYPYATEDTLGGYGGARGDVHATRSHAVLRPRPPFRGSCTTTSMPWEEAPVGVGGRAGS